MNPFTYFGVDPVLETLLDAKCQSAIRHKYRQFVAHAALTKASLLDSGEHVGGNVESLHPSADIRLAATILLDAKLAKKWLSGDMDFIENVRKSFEKDEKDDPRNRKVPAKCIEMSLQSHNVKILNSQLVFFPDLSLNEIDVRICWVQDNAIQRFFKKDCLAIPNIVSLRLYSNMLHRVSKHVSRLVRLQSLWLHDNFLSFVPDELCDITSLTELQLHKNPLIVLMPRTYTLTRLQKLTWDQKFVTNILPEIVDQGPQSVMKYLKLLAENRQSEGFLCLENLGLVKLPEWTRDTLPKYLIKCSENATFRWNSLKDISSLSIAPMLRSICLAYNKLMNFPKGLESLLSLQVIDFGFNQIQAMDTVLLLMTQLQVLDLRNNFITHVLLALSELTTLKRVDVKNNSIVTLPSWWSENWLQNVVEISWNLIKEPDLMSLGRSQNEIDQVLKKMYRSHLSKSLCITGMSWDKIPSMFLFQGLASLDCSNNIIAAWPESLAHCENLKSLCMASNNLSSVPDEIQLMTNLTYIDLSSNYIRKISKKIVNCNHIEIMNVAKNAISKLPSSFGVIGHCLRDLNLSGSGLMELPFTMHNLCGLVNLDASRNAISVLPQSVCALSNLQTMNLSHNFLKTLPDEVGCLNELLILNLSKNVLSALPSSICKCSRLLSLFLDRNNLSRLPIEICKLKSLRHLEISENRMLLRYGCIGCNPFEHKMPTWKLKHGMQVFVSSGQTKRLRLEYTGLLLMPVEVLDLEAMTDISLRGINCAETFGLLSSWSTLTRLDLRDTGIFEAPAFLGKCKDLKELFLDRQDRGDSEDSNLVQKALRDFVSIAKLVGANDPPQSLNIAPSLLALHDTAEKAALSGILQLKGLNLVGFPEFFFEMGKSLSEIDLSRNQICEIPNAALGLISLKTLRLNDNRLKSVPSSFAACTSLTMMNISHNCLTHIPFCINGMSELRHAFLQNNNILFLDGPFEGCTKLVSLNVSQNCISDISSKLSFCKLLQNIDLSFNNLEHMLFIGLVSLKSVSLNNNHICNIEKSYLSCTALQRVDISNNCLEDVSTLLSSSSIRQLVVTNNVVKEIPDDVKLAVSLVELHASSNRIEYVSSNLFMCPEITVVDLKNNCILYFAARAEQSETLSFLDISGNAGIQLCPSLGFLRAEVEFVFEIRNWEWPDPNNLSESTWDAVKIYLKRCFNALQDDALDLRNLQLTGNLRTIPLDRAGTKVPAHMFDKTNCKFLTLERNILSVIPEDVIGLQNLLELNVSNQAIEEIPASIFAMQHLRCLNARHTAITEIPKNVSLCTTLKYLLIGCNNIRCLPESIFAAPSLEVLDVSRCPIIKMPTSHYSAMLKIIALNQEEFDDFFKDSLQQNIFLMKSIASRLVALDDTNMVLRRTRNFMTFLMRFCEASAKQNTTAYRSTQVAVYFDLCHYTACPEYLTKMFHCRLIRVISISFNNFSVSYESLMSCFWDNIVELSLVDCHMHQLPSMCGNAWSSLTRLSLARNKFKVFPPQLLLLQQLVELDVSDNPLIYIPITMGSLKLLTKLHAFNCPLNGNSPHLPLARAETIVGFIQNLWASYKSGSFDMSAQMLEVPPNELRSKAYSSLTELRLQDNTITCWNRGQFSHLVSIKYLDVSINRLTDIDLRGMTNARHLNMSFNTLKSLPEGLDAMLSLAMLNASENRISAVPDHLSFCTNLTHLKLSRNCIMSMSSELTRLRKLETVELDGNRLCAFPKFCAGNRMRVLSIDENPIGELPVWLCQSRSLKFLSFRNAKVRFLPCELGNALQLESLMYDGNPLESPPIEIRRSGPFLTMKFLEMMGNCLHTGKLNFRELLMSELPPEMEMFDAQCKTSWCLQLRQAVEGTNTFNTSSLVSLDISNNKIRNLDVGFLHLFSNLVILNVESNNIKILPPFFSNLRSLINLSVKNNALQSLFPAIPACTTIEILDASQNSLLQIDSTIMFMQNLSSINILKNKIRFIPVEFGSLNSLKTLHADQSAVDNSVPSTVSGQGTRAFVVFMLRILKSQETSVLEVSHGDLFSVPRSISTLQGTIKIDLSHNNLSVQAVSDFLLVLEALENERQIELSKQSADAKLQSAIQQTLFAGKNNVKSGFAAVPMLLSLQTLILYANRLTEFPMVVSKIKQLTCLDIRENRIEVLPDGIRSLNSLITLRVSQLHLVYPPVHVAFSSESKLESETVDLEHFFKFVTATFPADNKLVLKVMAYGLTFVPDPWIVGDPFCDVQTVNLCDNSFNMLHKNDKCFFEKMGALTSLDLSGNRIDEIPSVFSVLKALKFLNLARNSIQVIPLILCGMVELESLSMDHNKILIIPEGITSLVKLHFLSLKGNQIIDLPPSMCKLGEVLNTLLVDDALNFPQKEIIWEGTAAIMYELNRVFNSMMATSQMMMSQGFYQVPRMLSEYTRVTQLNLSKNSISAIPDFFSNLVNLETIDFARNKLYHIGSWIAFASVLQNLDISHNNLSVLSSSLGASKSLKYVNASFNKIVTISRAILGSTSLLTLEITGNEGPITWLHFEGLKQRFDRARKEGIFLPVIEDIQAQNSMVPQSWAFASYVWCCSQPLWSVRNPSGDVILKEVPFDSVLDSLDHGIMTDSFDIMCSDETAEKKLFRTFKKISSSTVFCQAIHEWRRLRKQSYEIDENTWFLPNAINSINAQGCRFFNDALPTSFLRSCNLSILDMTNSMLVKLPRCIGFLKDLRVLKFKRNRIVTLPDELGRCYNLEIADFSQNCVEELPQIFAGLFKLIQFFIDENKLVQFPPSFASLKSLRTLSFANNKVETIDNLIGLRTLLHLDGSNNNITSMDPIHACDTLETVCLSGNKIQRLSNDVMLMTNLETLILRKNSLKMLPATLGMMPKLKALDLQDQSCDSLASLLAPAIFSCHVNGSALRRYLSTVEGLNSCTSLDLNFFDYSEIPKFVFAWTTKRQKARNRWIWAIRKTQSIVKSSLFSVTQMSSTETKAAEERATDVSKILGVQASDSNILLEKNAFDADKLDLRLDEYFGRDCSSSVSKHRTRRIPWQQKDAFTAERLTSEFPELMAIVNGANMSPNEKFEQIVNSMLLQKPFFLSMLEYSWFYSNQKIPDGGKMTTQGPLRIHGILILWLRDVLDLNSYIWADIVDENDAVLLYEWTKLSELPLFAEFLLLTTKCVQLVMSIKLVPEMDVLNLMSIALLKHHKAMIKKRAYRDSYNSAIEIGVSDVQLLLLDEDEVIKRYGKIMQMSESIEEDWEAVVGLEEKTAFLRNDESAVVAYSKFQEEFFLLRVLISTDDFTPLPKYRQFSFVRESTRLFMFGNKLKRIHPLLSCLHMLVEINFAGNELVDLPSKMKQLAQLQHLQLSRNRFQFLPEVLAQLGPNLLTLTLAWNSIKTIPEMVCRFSVIQELNLSYNMISSASNLLQLHTLTTLHLASNNLARMVPISKMSALTVLTLNHNPINYFPASIGNSNDCLKVLAIDSWTRAGLPPCYMPNVEFWLFTPPSSDEVFERPL